MDLPLALELHLVDAPRAACIHLPEASEVVQLCRVDMAADQFRGERLPSARAQATARLE